MRVFGKWLPAWRFAASGGCKQDGGGCVELSGDGRQQPDGVGRWVAASDNGVGGWAPEALVSPERGEISDEALFARVAARDETAFDRLVERYQARAYRLAWSFLRDAEDARDVSQEAFLRVYQAASRFRGDARFSTWFYRIVVNLALDHRRRRRWSQRVVTADPDEGEVPLVERLAAKEPDPGERLSQEQRVTRMWQAVDRLSRQQRVAIVLSVQEQLSTAEIAAVLDVAEPTVRVHLHRAVQALRRTMTP
jgi:RNA polymerase sigma-70 factor (ECF subfamily)